MSTKRRWAGIVLVVLWLGTGKGATAGVNLLRNPGFENATGSSAVSWALTGMGTKGGRMAVVADAAQAHAGAKCIRLDTSGGYALLRQNYGAPWCPSVYPGKRQRYLLTVFARGRQSKLTLRVLCYGDKIAKGAKRPPRALFPITSEWRRYTTAVTIPDGTTHLLAVVGMMAGAKGPLFVDDVALHDAREAHVRFLPSREQLIARVTGHWLRHARKVPPEYPLAADVRVFAKADPKGKPVLRGDLPKLADDFGIWRASTAKLPEGDYTVRVRIKNRAGQTLGEYEDWFQRRVFDWMRHPRGYGDDVPAPYTPLKVEGNAVAPWGRRYGFDAHGLPNAFVSQGKELLSGAMTLLGTADGKAIRWKTTEPFAFTASTPREVRGRAVLAGSDVRVTLDTQTEYDGFLLYRLTCAPAGKAAQLDRLRWRIPLKAAYCKFYSSDGTPSAWDGDELKPNAFKYSYDILPDRQGKVFDGLDRPQTWQLRPNFSGLFWLADYETCFCYAADNDRGWVHRDDAAAVEAFREGDELVVYLNLVNRPVTLTAPRTLEFAFQAGPTKPLPNGWRGIQYGGNPDDAPLTVRLVRHAGSGYTLAGASHFIHPGDSQEQQRKSRERIDKQLAEGNGKLALTGYHFWGRVPKGFAATRVFRSEWGIDKERWAAATTPRAWEWKNRFYGDNKDLYILMMVAGNLVPSHVDFVSYAYDEALKHSALTGFYDDTGYPKPGFDEDLGLGYIDENGSKVISSGLWVYRDRWKRAATINHKYGRPNFLMDSQHVRAHYMPAYGFIGLWAPCEHGYYNRYTDRDNYDFYGCLERYAAFNPARQFGQIPMVGMSCRRSELPHDTRSMMMLALLHDQDVGSFGRRDLRVVCRLRHARNRIRPWDDDVQFTGYWESKDWVKTDLRAARVSFYSRPDELLLMVGNTAKTVISTTVTPNWRKLSLDPTKLGVFDSETGDPLPLVGGQGIRLTIPSHEPKLVYVGRHGRFEGERVTSDALVPPNVLAEHSDPLAGPKLAPVWEKALHGGPLPSASIVDGRLLIQANGYGHGHVRRKFGIDNVSVQCMIMRGSRGGMDQFSPSLFLWWANGEFVQATPGMQCAKFYYAASTAKHRRGSAVNQKPTAPWYPYVVNWVKIVLRPKTVVFYGCADGRTWHRDWEIPRGERLAAAPEWLILGRGSAGKKPLLCNPHPKHFYPKRVGHMFFSDLVVARNPDPPATKKQTP